MPHKLIFTVNVRVPSKKNHYGVRKGGRGLYLGDNVKNAEEMIGFIASNEMAFNNIPMFEGNRNLHIGIIVYADRKKKIIDIDGQLTTIMDALKGIVYEDDETVASANIARRMHSHDYVEIIITPQVNQEAA